MFQFATLYAKSRDEGTDFYFQDPDYFDNYREEIRALFGEGISKTPYEVVAIHVRRGDYVNNPFYVDLMSTDYYERAMKEFPKANFVVLSDDIEWCRKQEIFKSCGFIHKDEVGDLNYMASCQGIIMANSSFSWWASYLSNARIIAPKEWYADGRNERTKLLPEWKRI